MSNRKSMLRIFKKDGKVIYQIISNNKVMSQSTRFNDLNLKLFKYRLSAN